LKTRLNDIVPISSTVNPKELVIYELDETDGSIKKLGNFEGIPSDKNFLNNSLGNTNLLFDSLSKHQFPRFQEINIEQREYFMKTHKVRIQFDAEIIIK
ncbi:MAG: hypothetical protein K9I82_14450, partial [Chitinophagaceae bacterium]|nr:hypothetical protein [Chitinophagaceae bacterium]